MKKKQSQLPSKKEVLEVRERIGDYIHRTPVLTSTSVNEIIGAKLFLKCENFQKMGAFKMRGAANAISMLSKEDLKKGVATHSSGNFAQAVALSARSMKVDATVVMPENAPEIKKRAVKEYGALVIISGSSPKEREAKLEEFIATSDASFIHPSNDLHVILGNATAAQELIEDVDKLDFILAPVGGGGLIAGTALATHYLSPETVVIGAEPAQAADAYRSLQSGEIQPSINPNTIADGLRTNLGNVNFPIIRSLVDQIILVEEDEIVEAMKMIWERMKIIIEPSSAVPIAAVKKHPELFAGKKVGIIVSGGNVDVQKLPW